MTLEIQQQRSLKPFNTFGLDVKAERLAIVHSHEELSEALVAAKTRDWPVMLLGSGSNVILSGDVRGLVIINRLSGIEVEGDTVVAGAGESWHGLVMRTIEQGLSGLENLALIPGTVGAAPIQNIGAYGVELESVFNHLWAIDRVTGEQVRLDRSDCEFGYRDSIFKRAYRERLVITRVALQLQRDFVPNLSYEELRREVSEVVALSPGMLAEAVCAIRRRKLPDPAVHGNAGSFFKNPLVTEVQLDVLRRIEPDVPWHLSAEGVKISAAWLIDRCGLKGRSVGAASVSSQHALVLVNTGEASSEDLLELAALVRAAISDRFNLLLEIEPTVY